jgi:hypothetical protein
VEALQDALRKLRLAMDALPARGAFQQLQDRADVRGSLHDLRELLATLAELLASQAERSRGMTNLQERADLFVERLDRIVEGEGGRDHDVRWYETFPRGFALYATPLDLAVPMRGLRERTLRVDPHLGHAVGSRQLRSLRASARAG